VADTKRWKKFCRQWQSLLKEKDIPYFHMKEFKNWSGYARKQLSREECAIFIPRFVGIVRKYVNFGISVSISEKDYQHYTSPRFRSQYGSPYALCIQALLFSLVHRYQTEPIAYIIESGHKNQSHLEKVFHTIVQIPYLKKRCRVARYAFLPKREALPLQAADLLAYLIADSWQKPQPSELQRLQKKIVHEIVHLGPEEIQKPVHEVEEAIKKGSR